MQAHFSAGVLSSSTSEEGLKRGGSWISGSRSTCGPSQFKNCYSGPLDCGSSRTSSVSRFFQPRGILSRVPAAIHLQLVNDECLSCSGLGWTSRKDISSWPSPT